MADNLDDFFAKRDKKKTKGKKFDTTDGLAKVLEQKAKAKKNMETGKSNYAQEGRQSPGPGLPAEDDDEWLEAEEKKPDFTGLKIQELVLSDDDDIDTKSQDGKETGDETSEGGVWKKKTKTNEEDGTKEEAVAVEEPKEKEPSEEKPEGDKENTEQGQDSSEPKKYVPPSMRNKQPVAPGSGASAATAASSVASRGGAYVPPSLRAGALGSSTAPIAKKKGAPTLADEESFPSLS